jgi:hypothetical protein
MIQLLKSLRPTDSLAVLALVGVGVLWLWLRPSSKAPRRYLLAIVLGYGFLSLPLGAGLLLVRGVRPGPASRCGRRRAVVVGRRVATFASVGWSPVSRGASRLRAMVAARVLGRSAPGCCSRPAARRIASNSSPKA